jgi:hypothetical protein
MKTLATIFSALSLARLILAHGYVDNATIGGVYYQVCEQRVRDDFMVLTDKTVLPGTRQVMDSA